MENQTNVPMPPHNKEDANQELKLGTPAAIGSDHVFAPPNPVSTQATVPSTVPEVVQNANWQAAPPPVAVKAPAAPDAQTAANLPASPDDVKKEEKTETAPTRVSVTGGAKKGKRNSAVGGRFPVRPSMCSMSEQLWDKASELFRHMDSDQSNAVTREEAMEFFKGAFKKASMEAMFNEIDQDQSGAITAEEFMDFWKQVKASGYSEQDILEEMEELLQGSTWVDWNDGRQTVVVKAEGFPRRPWLCKLSARLWKKCEDLFRKIDTDGKMVITEAKAEQFFQGSFKKMAVQAMFNEIDTDHHGQITPKPWMAFWVQVKGSGYKEKDMLEELEGLLQGGPWVDWKDGRKT